MSTRILSRMIGSLTMIVAMTLILAGCQRDTFRPLNESELETFYKTQNMTPLQHILLGESVLLLYEKGTDVGYCSLSVREPEAEMFKSCMSTPRSDNPIWVVRQTAGEYPFVAVVIQDPALISKTATIEATIGSSSHITSPTNGRASTILVSHPPVNNWGTITLYDAQGKVLYTQ